MKTTSACFPKALLLALLTVTWSGAVVAEESPQKALSGGTVIPVLTSGDIDPEVSPRAKAAKIQVQYVSGTINPGGSSTVTATLYGVSTYSDDIFSVEYPSGYAPPSFISVSNAVSVAPTSCCGPPSVAFIVSVASNAPSGTYTFAISYSYYTRLLNLFVGLEWVGVTVTVPPPPPSPPVAAFSASAVSGVAPLTVSFTNQSSGNPTSFNWSFGDGGTSAETNPTRTFTSPGTYTVQLTASNAGGSNTATRTITVTALPPPSPTAAFTSSVTSGNAPLTVSFTNQSIGNPTSYSWNFGDGGTSAETNPAHTYTTAGTYTVQLTASNAGGSNTTSATITVTAPPPPSPQPVAAFSASSSSLDFGQVNIGTSKTMQWTATNTGTGTLRISSIVISGNDASQFSITPSSATVNAGGSQVFSVAFSPVAAGPKTGILTFIHNADGNSFTVSLTGIGMAPVAETPLAVSVTELAMSDTRVNNTSRKSFNITNTGTRSVSITLAIDGPDASQFSMTPLRVTLGAGRSRTFTVTFAPTSAGSKSASVTITHNAAGNPLSVELRGQAIGTVAETPLAVSVTELAMNDTRVNNTSRKTFSVKNNSEKSAAITVTMTGPDASQFRVTPARVTLAVWVSQRTSV